MYYKNSLVIQAEFFYKIGTFFTRVVLFLQEWYFFYKIGTLAFKKCYEVLVFEKVEHIHCELWGMFVGKQY